MKSFKEYVVNEENIEIYKIKESFEKKLNKDYENMNWRIIPEFTSSMIFRKTEKAYGVRIYILDKDHDKVVISKNLYIPKLVVKQIYINKMNSELYKYGII